MTKTGKSSAYWNDVCHRYAQGTFQFSTGKRPGSRKWKEALERIDACLLQRGNKVDLFGRHIVCTCGFHKSTDKEEPNVVAGGSSEEAGTSQGEQGVKCSLCSVVVETEKFSEHLSDHHAEERCDTCGARVLLDSSNTVQPLWGPVGSMCQPFKKSHTISMPLTISTAGATSTALAVSTASTTSLSSSHHAAHSILAVLPTEDVLVGTNEDVGHSS